jgi:prepilin-type N-terminal cleavage/methylation domain-containing protein
VSARAARRAPRGLTLVEMMIALTVSALTIAAAASLLVHQQRAFVTGSADRAQQEAGRRALQELTRRLRSAGYGVDANQVLDFGATALVPRANLPGSVTAVSYPGYLCASAVRCRDSIDASASDEIVFLSRDPMFSRVASAVTTSSLTLAGDLKQPLYAGQLLQVSCMGGTRLRAYVTVGADVAAPATPLPTGSATVTLAGGISSGGVPEFGRENATLADGCFSLTGPLAPIVTAVERSRFFVAWYADDGTTVAPQTAGARPYLMLDQGLGGASPGLIPIAADVEDLQLSYLYPPAAAGGAPRVVGATEGTSIADEPFAVDTAPSPPAYDDVPDALSRTTGHPANILGIRVSAVVRSAEPDISLISDVDRTVPAAGNRPAFLGQANYRRTLFETTVQLPNLQTASFTYPNVNAAGGQGFNLGGG